MACQKSLTAGVIDDGKWRETTKGSEQGNLASPVIANIYMNYALAMWYEIVFKKQCRGYTGLVIYADDFVVTFQYEWEAKRFLDAIRERFALFGLELEPSKTRLVEFGRFAERNSKAKSQGKPETFDFLGFTHYCSHSRDGRFRVKRRSVNKKLNTKLKELNLWLKKNRHRRLKELFAILDMKLRGHYQFYGITDNSKSIGRYYYTMKRLLFKWLNRRSQRKSYTWEGFNSLLEIFKLTQQRILVSMYNCEFPNLKVKSRVR